MLRMSLGGDGLRLATRTLCFDLCHPSDGQPVGTGGSIHREDGCRTNSFGVLIDSGVATVQFPATGGAWSDQPGFCGNVADDFLPTFRGRERSDRSR